MAIQPRVPYSGFAHGIAMLPDGLQGAEGPAEALPDEHVDGFRYLGTADGLFVIENLPPGTANGESKVSVFGHRIAGKATVRAKQIGAPCANRAWYHRNTVQKIEGAFFEVLAGDVFERLPTREPTIAIDHLHVPGHCSDFGIGKMAHQQANRIRVNNRVGVDGNDDFASGFGKAMIQSGRLAAIGLHQ